MRFALFSLGRWTEWPDKKGVPQTLKQFDYAVVDELGLHARPAGQLVKKAEGFASEITISCKGKAVNLKRILGVMGLGVKCGDTVTVTADGEDEEEACKALLRFFEDNF